MSTVDHSAIAKQLMGEASQSAKAIAKDLFGNVPPGTVRQTKAQFLDMMRRNWADPHYRAAMGGFYDPQGLYHAGRLSPQAFLSAAQEAGLIGDWEAAVNGETPNGPS